MTFLCMITLMLLLTVECYTDEGKQKIEQLANNARFFRKTLREYGFLVYGDGDSPVVPMLTMDMGKMANFQRMLIDHGLATVVVGFPATPVCESRTRFCMSSAHSTEDVMDSDSFLLFLRQHKISRIQLLFFF